MVGAIFPMGVTAPVHYGPRITAWMSDLLHIQFSPEKRLADLMSDRFAMPISAATIAAMSRRNAQRFEDIVDRIRTVAPVKHLDETGSRIEDRTRWLRLLCTSFLTVRRIGAGCGDVDRDVTGNLVHDDDARDVTLEGVGHAARNAHHRRDLQAQPTSGRKTGPTACTASSNAPAGPRISHARPTGTCLVPGRSHRQSP